MLRKGMFVHALLESVVNVNFHFLNVYKHVRLLVNVKINVNKTVFVSVRMFYSIYILVFNKLH